MHKQVEVDRLASLKAAHVSNGNNVISFRRTSNARVALAA
jgi:hypothetical protein